MSSTLTSGRFSGLGLRVLSALILAPLMVALLLAGGLWFMGLMVVAALVSFHEWSGFSKKGKYPYLVLAIGAVYLSISYASYVWLRFGYEAGAWLAICIVLSVWASDIGAYFAGKFIGGPKLCPRLSPKKTWAGLAGAVLSCALMMEGLFQAGPLLPPWINTNINLDEAYGWLGVLLAGGLLGVVGQVGDLFISYFKRRADMKDTGHLIPGHGGLLDRIDALLLAAPVFLALCMIFL